MPCPRLIFAATVGTYLTNSALSADLPFTDAAKESDARDLVLARLEAADIDISTILNVLFVVGLSRLCLF